MNRRLSNSYGSVPPYSGVRSNVSPYSASVASSLESSAQAKASILAATQISELEALLSQLSPAVLREDVSLLLRLCTRIQYVVRHEFESSNGRNAAQIVEFLEGAVLHCLQGAIAAQGAGVLASVCSVCLADCEALPLPVTAALLLCLEAHQGLEQWPEAAKEQLKSARAKHEQRQQLERYCQAPYSPTQVLYRDQENRDPVLRVLKDVDPDYIANQQLMTFVGQDQGRTSFDKPLVSWGFMECSAIVIKNLSTNEYLLMHVSRGWEEMDCPDYRRFMDATGEKKLLPIYGTHSFDRSRMVQKMGLDGATVLPALYVNSGENVYRSINGAWGVVVAPGTNDLYVQLPGHIKAATLRFSDIFSRS